MAEMEGHVQHLVPDTGNESAVRVSAPRKYPERGIDRRLAIDKVVRGGHLEANNLVGKEPAVMHPERIQHQLPHGLLVGRASHDFDHAARYVDRCVVVGEYLARWCLSRKSRD